MVSLLASTDSRVCDIVLDYHVCGFHLVWCVIFMGSNVCATLCFTDITVCDRSDLLHYRSTLLRVLCMEFPLLSFYASALY